MALQFHNNIYVYILFMTFKFIFCSKRMKTIQVIKVTNYFDVIPLNNVGSFVTVSLSLMPSLFFKVWNH